MSGPRAPCTKALIMCGWEAVPIDTLLSEEHDLADPATQHAVHLMVLKADAVLAAIDCSTKSRIRDIPRCGAQGRWLPPPLRSQEFPLGLPSLTGARKARVARDNAAADFVLDEQDLKGVMIWEITHDVVDVHNRGRLLKMVRTSFAWHCMFDFL